MGTLALTAPYRANTLMAELEVQFPAWVTPTATGRQAHYTLTGDGQTGTLTWEDATAVSAVQAVVAAHNPSVPSAEEDLAAADQQAVDAFRAGWIAGQARLGNVGANAIQTQMDTIEAASITSVAAAAGHIKTLAEAVEDLARQLRVLKRTTAIPANVPDRLGG